MTQEAFADSQAASVQKVKSEKELAREQKKREKLEKFKQKQEKMAKTSETQKEKSKDKIKEKKEKQVIEYTKLIKAGEMKDITGAMPDSYSPKYVEAAWYAWWEKSGFFKPEYNKPEGENPKGKFVIVIPPPNVTGSLHLGHALTASIEDALVRWNRMCGKTTLWVPGCDHAGIATQSVMERLLWRERGLTRHDLGREAFLKEMFKYKEEKGVCIYEQFRRMGVSADWDRALYTMSPQGVKAVNEAFVRMHDQGLIYRSKRLVNWSCALNSAISDIEVNKEELTGRTMLSVPGYQEKIEFGVITFFAYIIDGSEEKIIVATTRLETMLGDTAIAVHPNDERYKHLHGKFAQHPFVNRKIPIITDQYVEMNFGSGAVKITPAHDQNDYEIGKRHNLPFINILSDAGTILEGYGDFSGMKRFHARKAVLEALKARGLFIETKENPMIVPICQRSNDVIEPLLKVQWYVNCKDMAARAVNVVKTGELKILPERSTQTWYYWLENIRDWCISRQLWWGHRIPVYYISSTDPASKVHSVEDDKRWVSGVNEEQARARAMAKFDIPVDHLLMSQDEDVLDTWFSSGLFPMATMGWPDKTPDFAEYFPGNLLETGSDILFFWVARMVMMSLQLTDKLPFTTVFLHSIVRDAHGRKMSKSLGNVIDPLDVIKGISLDDLHQTLYNSNLDPREIEKAIQGQKADFPQGIPECGTDALRFGLLSCCLPGRDTNLDIKRIEGYRFFCNKLWNAFKLCQLSFGETFSPLAEEKLTGNESAVDLWLLSRLHHAITESTHGFQTYDFQQVTTASYAFWLYDLCDVYLEHIKPILSNGTESEKHAARQTLYTAVHNGLRLLHPTMPYITEELYQRLPKRDSSSTLSIMLDSYPNSEAVPFSRDENLEKDAQFALDIVRKVRSLRSEYNLPTKQKVELFVKCEQENSTQILIPFKTTIQTLSFSSHLSLLSSHEKAPSDCATLTITSSCEAFLNLKGVIDVVKETERLEGKKEKITAPIHKLMTAMATDDYKQRVPEDVQTANNEKLEQLQGELIKVQEAIASISLLKN